MVSKKLKTTHAGGMPEYRHPRRGPIAAEYSSPGPAAYHQHNQNYVGYVEHAPTHTRAPAYSMRKRCQNDTQQLGPGPGAYDVRGNTRAGKDYIPGGSIARRYKPYEDAKQPGPGAYSPEECTCRVKLRAPNAFVFGKAHVAAATATTPGPATYAQNSSFGVQYPLSSKPNAPNYTISGREKFGNPWIESSGPAPNAYAVVAVDTYAAPRAPAYTHSGREKFDRNKRVGPGPGAYYPDLPSWKRRAPAFTMGIKHSIYAGVSKAHVKDMDW